jgi:hypothetical protein
MSSSDYKKWGGGAFGQNTFITYFSRTKIQSVSEKGLGFDYRHDQVAMVGSDGAECDLL